MDAIEDLSGAALDRAVPELAALLRRCVEAGASVNFVLPFPQDAAEAWWRRAVLPDVAAGMRRVLVAREGARDGVREGAREDAREDAREGARKGAPEGARLLGSVQLALAPQPNQPHRADVTKLLVDPAARRRGIGRALMAALETAARAEGRTLLTLDTVEGSPAGALYRAMGWVPLGTVPGYARSADGARLEGSTFFWKELR